MLFLMACHDVSIGNPCDAEFVLSEPSLYTYSLFIRTLFYLFYRRAYGYLTYQGRI